MEIEQELSQFQPFPELSIVAAENAHSAAPSSDYKLSDKADQKFQEIFVKLYQWLDSLTGQTSFKVLSSESKIQSFLKIFNLLRSQGMIADISFKLHRYNDTPAFIRCAIISAFSQESTDGLIFNRAIGNGFGKDVSMVLSKTIGEFLERYFLTLYQKRALLRSSYASLQRQKRKALNPAVLAGFSTDQKNKYPERKFNEDSLFYWEKTIRVSTGDAILVPAQLIYWNYDFNDAQEPALVEGNTNGAGGYFTAEAAILAGLYELIQRDAFFIYWLNRLVPPRIIPESVPDEKFQNIFQESKRYGFDIHCLNTTLDTGVPSFVVVIIDKSGRGPHFSLGAGCQANPVKAFRKALEEAWSVYHWSRPQPSYELPVQYIPFTDNSITQEKRLRLSANLAMAKYYDFFLAGELKNYQDLSFKHPQNFSSEKEELSYLIKQMENLGSGYEVLYYPARHPILEQLGYHSARVVVPQLVPLYLRETNAPLGAKRLKEIPIKLGLAAMKGFNPIPHPFP